ncbi:MAG: ATP-binding protein [Acidobacteriia bacterium]|nr:ATP-binding protein [Terriglobia bacterium]
MALSAAARKKLLEVDLPASQSVRAELLDYLRRTGLEVRDFASRIGYATVTLGFFLQGSYQSVAGSDRAIRSAILEFIRTHPIGGDVEVEAGRVYETGNFKILRRHFYECLDRGLAVYCYGPAGSQKTYLLTSMVSELNRAEVAKNGTARRAFMVYVRDGIRPNDLLKRIAEAAGTLSVGSTDRILRNLRFDFRGRRVLIVFDEAQHMDNHCLEVVRELLDSPPHAGLLFAGSHNLKTIFQQFDLEQWRSRIHASRSLPGISDEEARTIVTGEIGSGFPAKKIAGLIEAARVEDPRQGRNYTYISARKLFWSLRDLKAAIAKKNRGQEAAA